MIKCKFCKSNKLKKILNLGYTPLANSYVVKYQHFKFEKSYPLELYFCKKCKLIQAPHNISPNKIFVNYDYLSGVSNTEHFHLLFRCFSQYISSPYFLLLHC